MKWNYSISNQQWNTIFLYKNNQHMEMSFIKGVFGLLLIWQLFIQQVFAITVGVIQWYPLFTGLSINPRWLKIQFRIIFFGENITFFPQHFLELARISRRYSEYPDAYTAWNVISKINMIKSKQEYITA